MAWDCQCSFANVPKMTDQEIQALCSAAGLEPDHFRRHGLAKTGARNGLDGLQRTEGQAVSFAGLLRCYYATG